MFLTKESARISSTYFFILLALIFDYLMNQGIENCKSCTKWRLNDIQWTPYFLAAAPIRTCFAIHSLWYYHFFEKYYHLYELRNGHLNIIMQFSYTYQGSSSPLDSWTKCKNTYIIFSYRFLFTVSQKMFGHGEDPT